MGFGRFSANAKENTEGDNYIDDLAEPTELDDETCSSFLQFTVAPSIDGFFNHLCDRITSAYMKGAVESQSG